MIPHYSKWQPGDVYAIKNSIFGPRIIFAIMSINEKLMSIDTNLGHRYIDDETMKELSYHSSNCMILKLIFSV